VHGGCDGEVGRRRERAGCGGRRQQVVDEVVMSSGHLQVRVQMAMVGLVVGLLWGGWWRPHTGDVRTSELLLRGTAAVCRLHRVILKSSSSSLFRSTLCNYSSSKSRSEPDSKAHSNHKQLPKIQHQKIK